MKLINSLFSAFLMYSRIPMPKVEWKEENRRYAMCFFPLIGVVIGALFLLWRYICIRLEIGNLCFAAVAAAIPVALTGGIHMDGYCDVNDALASCSGRERQLEIMSDPHIGSFSLIKAALYFILQIGFFSQLDSITTTAVAAAGFVLSRALSGIAVSTVRCAKENSSLQNFVSPSHKNTTVSVLAAFAVLSCAAMLAADIYSGVIASVLAMLIFLHFRYFTMKHFGGITGDLAGWFLQRCEIAVLFAAAAGEVIF